MKMEAENAKSKAKDAAREQRAIREAVEEAKAFREHLDDVREGIIASKIAAHAADIANGLPGARDQDNEMSTARHKLDWDEMFRLALDPDKARRYYESTPPAERHTCSMCGKMCAVRTTNMILEGKTVKFCSEKNSCGE